MGFKEKIYEHAPLPLQNAIVSLYGLGWQQRRFGGVYPKEYKAAKDREAYTAGEWKSYTHEHLQKILVHAFTHVPYYKERYTASGFDLEHIQKITPDTLHRLPALEKEDLRKFGTSTLLSQQREKNGHFYSSSGTTGTPISILFSEAMHQRWSAIFEARIRNWAGLNRFNSRGMIGGRRIITTANAQAPFYRYNIFEKQVYFSAYHIAPANIDSYLEGLKKYRPDYMTGYAVGNYILAKFFDAYSKDVPPLKAMITSSEKLTEEMRTLFQKVYHCKSYDSYSGVEACGLISECEEGSLHISPDAGLIELLNDKGQSAQPGETAELVCTGFLNYDQPLIRYRIGDAVVVGETHCKCGREMPVVKDLVGRSEDVITGKDGRQMVRFHGLFIGLSDVIQGQVVQEAVDEFAINVVTVNGLSDAEDQKIRARIKSQLGEDISITIAELKEIPAGPNGKFKAVVSKLNNKIN